MLNKISKLGLLIALLFASTLSYAQLPVPFTVRYQSYIKGDMTVIANNIVNRKDYGNDPNTPYMNSTKTAKLNDEFEMFYIDIDNDMSTFSSSSAALEFDNIDTKKIVYAGLYWSATYKYNSGTKNKRNKFKPFDKNREDFDQIKLKLPGRMSYIDIKGEVIFDGLNKKGFDESAPYAVYADITDLVKDLENPTGDFTVANIKATQGTIEGGVSGGWTIFFVYEDENASGKFITSFDGFAGVTDKATDILYTGFKTLPEGRVFAKLACAGLEGDNNLLGDQLQIKSESSEFFTLLSNSLKPENNFFNSNIIIEDDFFINRKPNSKNTLGYDTSLITIYNPENSVIQNNTNNVTLKLKTVGDRFYMFFNAFNVEIQEPESQETMIVENTAPLTEATIVENTKKPAKEIIKEEIVFNTENTSVAPVKIDKKEAVVEPKKETVVASNEPKKAVSSQVIIPKKEVIVNHPKVKNEAVVAENSNKTTFDPVLISEKLSQVAQNQNGQKRRITAIPGPMVEIFNQQQGFYIIANVFAVHKNATRFVAKLRSMGIDADFFINPKNNYRYVFVSKHDSWSNALNLYYSNVNGKYYGDIWIMLVNTSPNQLVLNNSAIEYNNPFCPKQNLVATRTEEELV